MKYTEQLLQRLGALEAERSARLWLASLVLLLDESAEDGWPKRDDVAELVDTCWHDDLDAITTIAEDHRLTSRAVESAPRYFALCALTDTQPVLVELFHAILQGLSHPAEDDADLPRLDPDWARLNHQVVAYTKASEAHWKEGVLAQQTAQVLLDLLAQMPDAVDSSQWELIEQAATSIRALPAR